MPLRFDPRLQLRSLLAPWARRLVELQATPAQLALAAFGLSALTGALIAGLAWLAPDAERALLLLPLALLARALLEVLAGMLAEDQAPRDGPGGRAGQARRELLESLADALLYLPLALLPGVPGALVVLLVTLGLCTEIARLAAAGAGPGRHRAGPMSRSDRAIVFGVIGLILALDRGAALWLPWLLWPALLLALATLHNELRRADT